ncbi:hypothetical protein G7Y89_g8764 [Cudoniella acicularis]|uniref:Uncharacterized protein n=1 Tax=Cudoniella acicularis TaxID=354080 RepID=A0A8H4W2K5_9HELO|nr:hypothetical protein G7Y89_g8764 [Cudoniella acicularis]
MNAGSFESRAESRLPKLVIIEISVSIVALVVFLMMLGFWIILRHRRAPPMLGTKTEISESNGPELPDTNEILEMPQNELRNELVSNQPLVHGMNFRSRQEELERRREVPGWDQKFELDRSGEKFELTSNRPPVHELLTLERLQEMAS